MNRADHLVKNLVVESASAGARYTDLFARISEDEAGYTVQVRLYKGLRPEHAAWGEEIADSLETAARLIEMLAERFSIPQSRIKIKMRMRDVKSAIRH